MPNFTLASGNSHKAQEFSELFIDSSISIQAAESSLEIIEGKTSFFENAFLKAETYAKKFQTLTIADDSGLIVKSLPGELGVETARFGGDGLEQFQRNELLIAKLESVEDRSAYFQCVLCFYISASEYYFFEGRCEGEISTQAQGEGGFGYDPVFLPEGQKEKSLAELPEWKKQYSHRAIATKHAISFFS